jgi:hypothetical protein
VTAVLARNVGTLVDPGGRLNLLGMIAAAKRGGSSPETDPRKSEILSDSAWSGRRDSNPRPLDPQSSALTRLRYAPSMPNTFEP